MTKILIFTATYNEIDNIKKLIVLINKYMPKADILVVDDKSPDLTYKLLIKLKKKYKRLTVKLRKKKSWLKTAHKFSYPKAKKKKLWKINYYGCRLITWPSKIK